ncbi:uncharacterized protein LOC110860607 isoform X2 [Folsomia candida]|uniref:Uncharacterized protein n=1 Tax=Folsomia candida TaxID=158441 RepID=A0A226D7H0_FOLCA|nr:uncharacterized protein LOC110860607 isoform X2 [Folsomia candida]OXA40581.1 hypothetical protein Fcan01_24657 [Folsomia candida]
MEVDDNPPIDDPSPSTTQAALIEPQDLANVFDIPLQTITTQFETLKVEKQRLQEESKTILENFGGLDEFHDRSLDIQSRREYRKKKKEIEVKNDAFYERNDSVKGQAEKFRETLKTLKDKLDKEFKQMFEKLDEEITKDLNDRHPN